MTLYGLREEDLRVLHAIRDLPLATVADVSWAVGDMTDQRLRDAIASLQAAGLVTSVSIGFLGPRAERFHLTEYAQVQLEISNASWHQPGCLMRLLERLSAVEWLYAAATQITDMGSYSEFQWVDAVAFDAAVRYEHGWVALCWVGMLRTEKAIAGRLKDLGGDLDNLACDELHPRPGLLCLVVPDLWEAELVRRVAGRLRMEEWIAIWCVKDRSWHGAVHSTPSLGWVHQPAYRRKEGWNAWGKRVRESWFSEEGNGNPREILRRVRPALRVAMGDRHAANRWVGRALRELAELDRPGDAILWLRRAQDDLKQQPGGRDAAAIVGRVAGYLESPDPPADTARLLLAVAEWPGMSTGMAHAVLGEGPTGRRAQRALLRMADWGLVRRWREGRRMRYRTTEEGFKVLAEMDRTSAGSMWVTLRMDGWETGAISELHEYGLMDIAAGFLAEGCPVANGWRDNEPMGYSGGIVPDWMVWLTKTPFLQGWHYGEFERSARTEGPVTAKLTGFDSRLRVTVWPVLVVSADDDAEKVFHAVGERMGIEILTTTIKRAGDHGVVGGSDCWRLPEYLRGSTVFLSSGEPTVLG